MSRNFLYVILGVGVLCALVGIYFLVGQNIVLTGKDPNGVSLGRLASGETGVVKYVSGKIISNNQVGYYAPIWGVPHEQSRQDLMPLMPYAKEGMWTNAVFVEMSGTRIPFKEGQYEVTVKNITAREQEVRLNFHEARGYYSDNEGDATFSFEKR